MHILLSLVLALAVMIALVFGIVFLGVSLAGSAGKAVQHGPMKSGLVPRIAFVLLWVLIFGTSFGMIGAA
ncbi:hypothetical protein CLV78_102549 [Aliiruegeria haliotis]|uniref:Uncharacterized protein n=1 Tax=Aliiruegeria haliotis TaxID=1280846 RepID=A0A2T0RW17_9RHOB|nr:hypothetical protein [Aliiruegeria haliotis]PRY25371.1 hypothetical protein CLV78_102549 [Aliiruegeria haliotis]